MAEKNTAKVDVHLTDEQKLALQRLSALAGEELSPYLRSILIEHLATKHRLMVSLRDVFDGCEGAVSSGEQLAAGEGG